MLKTRTIFYLGFVTLALYALSLASPPANATAPRIVCQISMANWCLVGFDGAISMHESAAGRIWELRARGSKEQSSLQITESIDCIDHSESEVRLIEQSEHRSLTGNRFQRVVYSLTSQGCKLSFDIPFGQNFADYRQYMLYGILVGNDRSTQLYRFSKPN